MNNEKTSSIDETLAHAAEGKNDFPPHERSPKAINIDSSEQIKFAHLASSWWDEQGPMRPLHKMNPLRCKFINDHANLNQERAADIGCGGGILAESLAQLGAKVTAVDINEELIKVAEQHAKLNSLDIHYQIGDVTLLQQSADFAVVTCLELLEHVPDPAQLIQECASLLQPEGKVFFSTLNRNFKSFMGAIVGAEYILGMLPRGTHHYGQFIRPAELTRWANAAGLQLINLQGIQYRPLHQEFVLSNDVSINYIACFESR